MSNLGQAALVVVGAIAGYFLGPAGYGATYALLGAALGGAVGQVLFPTQLPSVAGPRINDHNTTSSSLGDPVIIGYGKFPTTGTVMFLDQLIETATTTDQSGGGGSGGPTQTSTTYSYTQSIGIGLCETTTMLGVNTPLASMQRVWENGELVYDVRSQQPGELAADYSARIAYSLTYAGTFTLYLGTETQLPDPTIELQQGANTLYYRGLAYIVYPNRILRSDQGLRHPSFRFEVIKGASNVAPRIVFPTFLPDASNTELQPQIAADTINAKYYIWNGATGHWAVLGFNLLDNTQFAENNSLPGFAEFGGVGLAVTPDGSPIVVWFNTADSCAIAKLDPTTLNIDSSSSYPISSAAWVNFASATINFGTGPIYLVAAINVSGNFTITDTTTFTSTVISFVDASAFCVAAGANESGSAVFWVVSNNPSGGPTGGDFKINNITYGPPTLIAGTSVPGAIINNVTASFTPADIDPSWTWISVVGSLIVDPADGHLMIRVAGNGAAATNTVYLMKIDGYTGQIDWKTPIATPSNYNYGIGQNQILNGLWWLADNPPGNTGYYAVDTVSGDVTAVSFSSLDLGTQGEAVTASTLDGGLILTTLQGGPAGSSPGWTLIFPSFATVSDTTIASIVKDICDRSNCPSDTSSLGDEGIPGFVISTVPMLGRDAMVPLRAVGFFDSCESGDVMRFVRRGAAPVMTLTPSDIGAYETGTSDDPAPAISVTIAMETDLPQQLRLTYMSPARDYQSGQQLSPTRYDTMANQITDVELGGVCLSDDQAAQVAEIDWNDAWASDHTYSFAVDQSKAALEPADVVLVPMVDTLVRVRVTAIDDASQILRTITAVSDDDGAYVSSAVSALPPYTTTMRFFAPTNLILMDSPLLLDSNDTGRVSAPLYIAAYPASSASTTVTWGGAGVYESDDGGATYTNVATITGAPVIGQATTVLAGVTQSFITDTTNSVTVKIVSGALPTSITTLALLNGGNSAAMLDASGTVELFQFRDVAIVSSDTVTLSYLLRGRRGSDTMTTGHAIGSMLIMLGGVGSVKKANIAIPDLGTQTEWKAVGINDTLTGAAAVPFTSIGRSLFPYAPVHLRATSIGFGGDIHIAFTRRARIGAAEWVDQETDTLPIAEDTEAYSLDIFKDGAVIRTIPAAPTFFDGSPFPIVYPAASVTADFGSIPAFLTVALYQLSGEVGRGFAYLVTCPMDQNIEGVIGQPPAALPIAAAPTLSIPAGTYATTEDLALATTTPGGQIYFTTDNSTPSATNGTLYSADIVIGATQTIKAITVAAGYQNSLVVTAVYTITTSGGGGTQVATPTASVAAGTYPNAFTVTLADATSGATIYWTDDGTKPTVLSNVYSTAIPIDGNTTLQAIGVKTGLTTSPVAGFVYTLKAAAPTFSNPGGTYDNATTTTISDATSGAAIHVTVDGTTPDSSSPLYSSAITITNGLVIKVLVIATGFGNSDVSTQTYVLQVATTTFSPVPGGYATAQNVTPANATSGASLYYTDDDTTPTTGSTHWTSGTIAIPANATLKFLAVKTGYLDSAIATGVYNIGGSGIVPRPSANIGNGLYVAAGRLNNIDGTEFRPRGTDRAHYNSPSFPGLVNCNSNTMRVLLETIYGASPADLLAVLQEAVNNDIVPIAINQDLTTSGSSSTTTLFGTIDWFVTNASLFAPLLNRYGILNVANEWGSGSLSDAAWAAGYTDPVNGLAKLRTAGYTGPLMVDANRSGQSVTCFPAQAAAILASDPQKNTFFDFHMYGVIPDVTTMNSYAATMAALRPSNICFIWGEFGPGRNIGPSPTLITPTQVIDAAEANNFGWIAWAWDDNNLPNALADNNWFDMTLTGPGTYTGSNSQLTEFGIETVPFLKSLAVKATIF